MSMNAPISLNIRSGYGSLYRVGILKITNFEATGQRVGVSECLDVGVESVRLSPSPAQTGNPEIETHSYSWLHLEVSIWTNNAPRKRIGTVHCQGDGLISVGDVDSIPTRWQWELNSHDIECVNDSHYDQAHNPFNFIMDISGVAKQHDSSGVAVDIVPLRSVNNYVSIPFSQWEKLTQDLGLAFPPTVAELVDKPMQQHPSWSNAISSLDDARGHLRAGEDYDALRDCLSALESLVSQPYRVDNWRSRLSTLEPQKADGLAQLFSSLATYCNRVGHHRSKEERDHGGDLVQMPLDHWEAELAVGTT